MIAKKYIIGVGMAATVLGGALLLASVQADDQTNMTSGTNESSQSHAMVGESHPQPMVLQVGPGGRVLLRGTVDAVGANSLTVKSWGGDWMVNVSSSTDVMPTSDLSQVKTGDFVGVQGSVNQSGAWMIDATLVRDWTSKQAMQTNKQEIKQMMNSESPKNWQGTASNVNASGNSFTLTVDGTAYTVNVAANAKVVNEKFLPVSLSDIKDGDTVRVWGTLSGTTLTVLVVRDVSIAAPAMSH